MTVQTTTKKALETAHQAAGDILDGASDTMQSARDMANRSLDKADSRIHHLRRDVDPRIDDIAAKVQQAARNSSKHPSRHSTTRKDTP